MTESKLRFWEIALLFALAAALMWGSWSLQQQDRLERKMIRLHVIANSDSEADQALKLQVRDRVLTLATDILRRADSREQAERDIEAALPDLQAAAADEIADIVSAQCPPVVPENCDAFSCRECWLAWLTTGEPPKEKGPSDKQTAPGRDSAPYYPPTEAIRKAAERLKDGNMEYTAIALIRAHDGEELPQP